MADPTHNQMEHEETERPVVQIIGHDGNAFAILGACMRAAKKAQWPQEKRDKFYKEATSGDYDHLLASVSEWFEVE